MRRFTFRLVCPALLSVLFVLISFPGPVFAEAPGPEEARAEAGGPGGGGIIPPEGGTITIPQIPQVVPPKFDPKPPEGQNVMVRLLNAAMSSTEIMATYLNRTLLERLTFIAKWLAVGFVLLSFLFTYVSNPGMDFDGLVGNFLRFGVCVALIPVAPGIISGVFKMGCSLAEVSGAGKMQRDLRLKVDRDFDQFWTDMFLVDVSGDPSMQKVSLRKLDQRTGEIKSFVSVLSNYETKLPSVSVVTENASPTTWTVPEMIAFTSFSRTVVEFSNVMLTFLLFFLKVGLVLVAPFMCALAINREFAQRAVKNFAWTTLFAMFFLPLTSKVIGILSYLAADLSLMSVREAQHTWDPNTFHAITARGSDMALSCGAFGVLSLISSVALFASPVIVYRFSTGDVAQAITGVAGQWMYSMVASGIGLYSAGVGAAMTRQSEVMQANTTASVGNDQAKKENNWQRQMNDASARAQHMNIEGQRRQGLAGIEAGRVTSNGNAVATRDYETKTANANFGLSQGTLNTERQVQKGMFQDTWNRETHPVRTTADFVSAFPTVSGTGQALQRGQAGLENLAYGQPDITRPLSSPPLTDNPQPFMVDSVFQGAQGYRSSNERYKYQQEVNSAYRDQVVGATNEKSDAFIASNNKGAAIASGGVNANASFAHGGVEIVRGAQNSIADQQMVAKIGWNTQIQETAIEAANTRAWGQVFGHVGEQLASHVREASNMYRV